MDIKEIKKKINQVIKETGFKEENEIYRGTYYEENNLRNLIYSGIYKGKPAILKYYADPRITDEPISLSSFLLCNKSKILTAPKLYKKEIVSPHEGWFISEMIPRGFDCFKRLSNREDRKEFLNIYLEYRNNFPKKQTRKLLLVEKLSADNFHIFRINRWLELAQNVEARRQIENKKLLLNEEFLKLYEESIEVIRKDFKNRGMVWCHGHFKAHELFFSKDKDKYYLIDFAHTAMYPEGYELASIVWSDYLMDSEKWNTPFNKWKLGVYEWINDIEHVAKETKIKKYKILIKASLIERILGTILADITSSSRLDTEKRRGVNLMIELLKELL
ncbi:MAG: phosphotransferase [Patescibacteria group bacterium]|jgi:hypothetical protein|nr:phosphotransferase [Patescibacteria group bacterium]